jgi:hypothetical protein
LGGTGVAPVKSGVTPDFVVRRPTQIIGTGDSNRISSKVSGATPETTGWKPVPPRQHNELVLE